MSSTTRISNYPSVSVAALETALNYLRLAPELDETTLENLAPKVSPKLLDRVKSALNTHLPLTRLFVYQEEEGQGSKRQKTERLPRSEVTLVEKRWRALLACNPPGSEEDEMLKRRARVATVESLFFNNSQLIESNPVFGITASYLDIRDLCRLGATSTMFNHLTSQDSLWKGLSKTLSLGEDFWPEYSKTRLRKNYIMLGRICRAFHVCCTNAERQRALKRAANLEQLPENSANWGADRRAFFGNSIKPLMTRMFLHRIPREYYHVNNCAYALTRLNSLKDKDLSPDFVFSVVDMFMASGSPDKDLLFELLTGYPDEADFLKPPEGPLVESINRVIEHSDSPNSRGELLGEFFDRFAWMSPSRFVPIAIRLIKKDEELDLIDLVKAARQGFVELFEPLIPRYMNALRDENYDGPRNNNDLAGLITLLTLSERRLSAEQILYAIDLLQKQLRPDLPLNWNPSSWTRFVFDEFMDQDPFLNFARYRDDALMKKVISLGLKPFNRTQIHELEALAWHDEGCTIEYAPTLKTALTGFTALSRNPLLDPAYQTIAFLVKHGAKPPKNVLKLIEANTQFSFEVKQALKRLFSPQKDEQILQPPEEPHSH